MPGGATQQIALDITDGAPHISHAALQQRQAPVLDAVHPEGEVRTMAKTAKAAGDKVNDAAENIETAMKNGTEAFKAGFDKAVKNYDQLARYGKDTVEAYVKSANAAGKGAETLHNELYTYSKQSVEESIAAAKTLLGAKSVHEAFELQSDFAKTAFNAYVGQVTKLSELFVATTKEALEPLQGRVQAWVEVAQTARAA
jgi:phasin family protein